MDKQIKVNGCTVVLNEPMSAHTSFKIGGAAEYFVTAETREGLAGILKYCADNDMRVFALGNGTNLLVSDNGIKGVVVKLGGEFSNIELADDNTIICGAGAMLSKVCAFALENSLTGLEFAWGIPGSAGGAAFMNAGAYGGEMKDVLVSCEHIDIRTGETGSFSGDELDLKYRHSAYSAEGKIITKLVLKLKQGDKAEIRAKMDDLLQRRKDKQPVEYPSAGSVFKRPEGYFAGTLIEQCNLKGASVGGASVSEKHAGFIINKNGNATCADVVDLIKKIQITVKKETGVTLECEVKVIE